MNRPATKARIDEKCIMLKKWCRKNVLPYQATISLINGTGEILETKKQRNIIAALKADGLYVASEEDSK